MWQICFEVIYTQQKLASHSTQYTEMQISGTCIIFFFSKQGDNLALYESNHTDSPDLVEWIYLLKIVTLQVAVKWDRGKGYFLLVWHRDKLRLVWRDPVWTGVEDNLGNNDCLSCVSGNNVYGLSNVWGRVFIVKIPSKGCWVVVRCLWNDMHCEMLGVCVGGGGEPLLNVWGKDDLCLSVV